MEQTNLFCQQDSAPSLSDDIRKCVTWRASASSLFKWRCILHVRLGSHLPMTCHLCLWKIKDSLQVKKKSYKSSSEFWSWCTRETKDADKSIPVPLFLQFNFSLLDKPQSGSISFTMKVDFCSTVTHIRRNWFLWWGLCVLQPISHSSSFNSPFCFHYCQQDLTMIYCE